MSPLNPRTPAAARRLARMLQPRALQTADYYAWSRGRGVDAWNMIRACVAGDLEAVRALLAADPALVQCEFEYFKPIRFAIRENHRELAGFLFAHGAGPDDEAGEGLLEIARDRGYTELAAELESIRARRFGVSPAGDALAAAIRARDIDQVRRLLDTDPRAVDAADARCNRPIHWAVMTRQIAMIDLLLERGADIDAPRPDGLRPIHLTNGDYHYRGWRDVPAEALQRHEVLIGYLLSRGATYDLATATRLGDLDRVRLLVDREPESVNAVPVYSYYTGLPLRNAAGAGHLAVVRFLLERGADPNQPEPGIAPHGSALHNAIGGKHWEVVKVLLEHGANPNAEVESSGNCLFMAKHVSAPARVIDLLVSYGAVMGAGLADLETLGAMLHANPSLDVDERLDSEEMVRLLLRYQPDLLRRSPDPNAWWSHSTAKSPAFARWLFEHGLDPNRRNWLGITLLHRCAAKPDLAVAEACLEAGADINAMETEWCSTPLGWAARHGRHDMVEWLLAHGADPSLPLDEPWARPVEWARRRGHDNIASLFA